MILQKIKIKIKNSRTGFVILFAVTLSSIILAISMGIADVALKEIKFGTSVRDSNNAFFAADTGIECALKNDKPPSLFDIEGPAVALACDGVSMPTFFGTATTGLYDFIISGLGSVEQSCVKVSVFKESMSVDESIRTTITSKGYHKDDDLCSGSNPDRIEREIKANY